MFRGIDLFVVGTWSFTLRGDSDELRQSIFD